MPRSATPYRPNTLDECRESAKFWAEQLPGYGQHMRNLADLFALTATSLSTLTGLAVWTTLQDSTKWWAVALVSAASLIAAVAAAVPKLRDYRSCGKDSLRLATQYGEVLGLIEKAQIGSGDADAAQARFDVVRADKMKLDPYPDALQTRLNAMRVTQVVSTQ